MLSSWKLHVSSKESRFPREEQGVSRPDKVEGDGEGGNALQCCDMMLRVYASCCVLREGMAKEISPAPILRAGLWCEPSLFS